VVCSSLFDISTCHLQNVTFILIFVQNLSPLHEAAEAADLLKFDPDLVGVAGSVAKIKVVYNLILLTGISVVCMTYAYYAPPRSGVMPEQKIGLVFMYTDLL